MTLPTEERYQTPQQQQQQQPRTQSLYQRIKEHGFDSDSDDDVVLLPGQEDRPQLAWSDYLNPVTLCSELYRGAGIVYRQLRVFTLLNFKDIASRKVNYCLGLLSCFVVVLVTALMLTVLTRLPVLFLKLGELSEGQIDFRITPGGDASAAQSLNYSRVLDTPLFTTGAGSEMYRFHSPRILFDGNDKIRATNVAVCNYSSLGDLWNTTQALISAPPFVGGPTASSNCEQTPCVSAFCSADVQSYDVPQWVWIDSERENVAGMGAKFPSFGSPLSTGIPAGTVVVDRAAANFLNVSVNDTIILSGSVTQKLLEAFIASGLITTIDRPYSIYNSIAMPVRIFGIVEETHGKLPSDSENVFFSEYATTLAYMAAFLSPNLDPVSRAAFAQVDPNSMATEMNWNYPPSVRFDSYTHSDYAKVLAAGTSFAGPIVTTLGFNQVEISVPIVEFMEGTRFFSLFLGLIVSIIIAGLGALSVVLVYSLLIVGIQTRQFELGVMRMVGFTRTDLIMYIATGASLFAVPAMVIGLVVAQLSFIGIRGAMQTALDVEMPALLEPDAVGLAVFAGIIIPLVASISPVLELLSLTLPDALNTQRGRVQAILYDIQTDAERPINWTLVIFGVALTIFGFLIYYMFPLALFTFDLTLLFYIFFSLLLGMLFGCILLAMNFDHFAQTLVAYVFFYLEREAVFKLVRANLVAHRRRNRSNSLMFATAVGFIVFITVAFDIQIQSIKYQNARDAGGELRATFEKSSWPYTFTYGRMLPLDNKLRELKYGPAFDGVGAQMPDIEWTWASLRLNYLDNDIDNATMETLGRFRSFGSTDISSVAPNFYEVADPSFLIVEGEADMPEDAARASAARQPGWGGAGGGSALTDAQQSHQSGMTFSEYLYTREGSGRAVISTYAKEFFGLEGFADDNDMFQIIVKKPGIGTADDISMRGVALPVAVLDAAPVFRFSKFRDTRRPMPASISLPSFVLRSNDSVTTVQDMLFHSLVVKCSRGQAGEISQSFSTTPSISLNGVRVGVLSKGEDNLELAQTIVGFFFAFTQGIAMAVCFFALISTMSTNIYEQQKEIGILRAIGAPYDYVKRVFVEEAFVLVFAACLLGTVIGTVVAFTMLIQRALFTQLPLPFSFPTFNVVLMLILSVIFSIASTWAPIKGVLNAPSITHILRKAI